MFVRRVRTKFIGNWHAIDKHRRITKLPAACSRRMTVSIVDNWDRRRVPGMTASFSSFRFRLGLGGAKAEPPFTFHEPFPSRRVFPENETLPLNVDGSLNQRRRGVESLKIPVYLVSPPEARFSFSFVSFSRYNTVPVARRQRRPMMIHRAAVSAPLRREPSTVFQGVRGKLAGRIYR